MLRIILAVALLLTRIILAAQNAGVLDNGFGTNGVVTTTLTPGQLNGINKLLQQPDGKLIAIGATNDYVSNSDIAVVRYNIDGSLDNTFGSSGIALHNSGSVDAAQNGILQADGKIILVGIKNFSTVGSRAIIMRLNSDGSIDNSFDGDGIMEFGPATGTNNRFLDIERDGMGNYFVCGQFDNAGTVDVAVVKLTASLAIDNSYGTLGIAQFSTGAGMNDYPGGISIQADGKVVGAGYTEIGSNRAPLVWRLTTTGILDNSFAGTGWLHYSVGGQRYFTDVAIQSTGRILAAGFEYFVGQPRVICKAFDTNGIELPFNVGNDPSYFTVIVNITMQDDDRFLLSGYTMAINFYLARYDADGNKQDINPDPGNQQLDSELFFTGNRDYGYALLIQADGKYVLGGYTGTGSINESGTLSFALARFAGLTADVSLPVRLLSFMAEKNSGQVRLSWKTGWEENTDRFVVERSASGNVFTSIGSISAGGGSNGGNYSFTDLSPLSMGFYRLKMLDKDGQFAYSNVIAVKSTDGIRKMIVFPNPATDFLFIQSGDNKGPASLSVIDALGRLVKKEQQLLTGNNAFSIDLRSLPKGHYYVVLDCGGRREVTTCNKY